MKHELFALEQSSVYLNDRQMFNAFDLRIYQGEILGILCDSVTEQDAVVALFRGSCHVDGTLRFFGKQIFGRAARTSFSDTFFVLDSQINLISSFSIAENICIFTDRHQMVDHRRYLLQTEEYFRRFDIPIDPARPIALLTAYERILVLLIKAYAEQRRIIVLNRVTELVSEQEFQGISRLIHRMIENGYTFVIIDSIATNIFSETDEILVIRKHTSVACFESAFFDRQSFLSYMLSSEGSPLGEPELVYDEEDADLTARLTLDHVSTSSLRLVSLSAAKGELLKILCLDQKSLDAFRGLFYGEEALREGRILLDNVPLAPQRELTGYMRCGIQWCPESPWQNAVVKSMSLRDNLMLPLSLKVGHIWMKNGFAQNIDQYLQQKLFMEKPVRKASHYPPEVLQKLAYARILTSAPKVVFVEKPFTETDLHIRETTLLMLRTLLARGITVILLTMTRSDLSLIDGDELYARDGALICEEEMYAAFFETAP